MKTRNGPLFFNSIWHIKHIVRHKIIEIEAALMGPVFIELAAIIPN